MFKLMKWKDGNGNWDVKEIVVDVVVIGGVIGLLFCGYLLGSHELPKECLGCQP